MALCVCVRALKYVGELVCERDCVSCRHNTFKNQHYVQLPGNEVFEANMKQRAHCDLNSLFFVKWAKVCPGNSTAGCDQVNVT